MQITPTGREFAGCFASGRYGSNWLYCAEFPLLRRVVGLEVGVEELRKGRGRLVRDPGKIGGASAKNAGALLRAPTGGMTGVPVMLLEADSSGDDRGGGTEDCSPAPAELSRSWEGDSGRRLVMRCDLIPATGVRPGLST